MFIPFDAIKDIRSLVVFAIVIIGAMYIVKYICHNVSFSNDGEYCSNAVTARLDVKNIIRLLPEQAYSVYSGIILKNSAGIAEIDNLVISKYGIFLLENRYYERSLICKENSDTQEYADLSFSDLIGTKSEMQNPVKRLTENTKVFIAETNVNPDYIHPAIVYTGTQDHDVKMETAFIHASDVVKQISKFTKTVLTEEELENIKTRMENTRKLG